MLELFQADHAGHGIQHAVIWWIPLLAFTTSVVGSIVGLACARRANYALDERSRIRWQIFAAVSIGGVAIWLMHFLAMLGMSIPGAPIRFDLPLTLLSAALATVAVFVGLRIAGRTVRPLRLIAGGIVMGAAVNIMHYLGMFAMRFQGTMSYDPLLVAASVAIAVVAATVALWFTLVLNSRLLRAVAGVIMGVAVVGMHYTGMLAMRVTVDLNAPAPTGLEVFDFLFPTWVVGLTALAVPMTAILIAPPLPQQAPARSRAAAPAVVPAAPVSESTTV